MNNKMYILKNCSILDIVYLKFGEILFNLIIFQNNLDDCLNLILVSVFAYFSIPVSFGYYSTFDSTLILLLLLFDFKFQSVSL